MIPILYEESHFLVVNKPAGLLTQAVPGVDSLQVRLIEQLRQRDQHSGRPFIGLPHRLDRGTSGALLIARNQRALKRFGAQFQHRKVQKFYAAWVEGVLPPKVQKWQDFLRKIENQAQAELVLPDVTGARMAELELRPIASIGNHSLVLVRLLTGRMHQIRLQLSSRNLPIVGDQLYGSCLRFVAEDQNALHALRIEFRHPTSAAHLAVTAPFPDTWSQAGQVIQAACQRLYQISFQSSDKQWSLESFEYDDLGGE